MQKIVMVVLLFVSVVWGDSNIVIKAGWQLMGFDRKIEDLSIFDEEHVEQLWVYDATSQQWKGYAPSQAIRKKIEASYPLLSTIERWQGVWIKSRKAWLLKQSDAPKSDTPIDTITLKKGWNLISLPINSVVSPKLFKNALVWQYKNRSWEVAGENAPESFVPIQSIRSDEGVWIRAKEDTTIDISQQSASLQTFTSKEAMRYYLKKMLYAHDRERVYYYKQPLILEDRIGVSIETTSTDVSSEKVAENTTSTNLQEAGVEESNTIQNDGRYIYYLNRKHNTIEVHAFGDLANQHNAPVARLDINESDRTIDSFYLYGQKLVVLMRRNRYYSSSVTSKDEEKRKQLFIALYDTSTIDQITKEEEFAIEADLVSSRIVGKRLMVVGRFRPEAEIVYSKIYLDDAKECKQVYPTIMTKEEQAGKPTVDPIRCYGVQFDKEGRAFKYDYGHYKITQTHLIPQLSTSHYKGDAISYQNFYAPIKLNQSPLITMLLAFDLEQNRFVKSSAIAGNASIVYASPKSLYTVSQEYPLFYGYNAFKERSVIYKFDMEQMAFGAMGVVSGRALNQFALSEYNDHLRIATTQGFSWQGDTTNAIAVLKQSGLALEQVGYLGSLGKEGETIRAVRFMGEKGFVVTFKQTDPLYTLDLSDPTDPQRVGELHLDGFSQYLHLVDDDTLLAIGRDATPEGRREGIALQLFDISDFANPTLADKITIGDSSYNSEALQNHKAFLYRQSDRLFGLDYYSWNRSQRHDFGLYQVVGKELKAIDELSQEGSSYQCNPRSVLYDLQSQSYLSFFCSDGVATHKITKE